MVDGQGSALSSGSTPDAVTFSVKRTPIYIFLKRPVEIRGVLRYNEKNVCGEEKYD